MNLFEIIGIAFGVLVLLIIIIGSLPIEIKEHKMPPRKPKPKKEKWPTQKMLNNYYRTGNFRYLYDEDYDGR